jgi:hypothetical protein
MLTAPAAGRHPVLPPERPLERPAVEGPHRSRDRRLSHELTISGGTVSDTEFTERLTRDNAALLLVDRQVGLYTGVRDSPLAELKHVVDASGTFSQTKRETGLLRMQQAGITPIDYATAIVEILADNADPLAGEVYAALDMPFAVLVDQVAQAFTKN